MRKIALCLVLLCVLGLVPLEAEKEAREKEKETETGAVREYVVVTASGIQEKFEAPVTPLLLLTAEEIAGSRAFTLNEALNLAPGVLTLGSGEYGQLSSGYVRGASAKHVLYMINGVRINDPAALSLDLAGLAPGVFQQVEIVEGPYSGLYGSDAMGGTVNLVTGSVQGGRLSLGAGGAGSYNGRLSWGLPLGRIGGLTLAYDHFQTAGEMQNSDFSSQNALLGFELRHGAWRAEPFFYLNRADLGIPLNYGFPSPDRRANSGLLVLGLPLHFQAGPKTSLELTAGYYRRDYELEDEDDPWGGDYRTRSDNFQFRTRLLGNWLNELSPTVLGLELNRAVIDEYSAGYQSFDAYAFNSRSFWLQQIFRDKGWNLQAALRADSYQGSGFHLSPRFSAAHTWRLENGFLLGLYAVNSFGYRSPKPVELASPWGNPDLQPEKSLNFEAGFSLARGAFSLRAGYFNTSFRELIVFDYAAYRLANSSRDLVRGWQLQPRLDLGPHFITLSWQKMTARNEISGEELLRRPGHLIQARLHLDFRRFYLNAFARLVGGRKDYDELNWITVDAAGFAVFSAAAGLRLHRQASFYLKVLNVFDQRYEEIFGYRAPGRRIHFGLDITF